MFKIKSGYYRKRLTPETIELLESTKSKITKDENGENIPYSEIHELVLINCKAVHNSYQQSSRVLYTFIPNKYFGHLLDISSENFYILKNV